MLGKDVVVVISDSGNLSFLTFCNEMHRFSPLAHVQLSNPGNSRQQPGRMLAVDSREWSLQYVLILIDTSWHLLVIVIAIGDCCDGILFYSYHEDSKKLEHMYSDPSQKLVADCILMDVDTAVVSDRKGSIAVLSSSDRLEIPIKCPVISNCHSSLKNDCIQVCANPTFAFGNGEDNV
ncbi:hypothetical protein FH972_020119 [Carpinus fangiana]|uniref:Uncharacterized protein n=1 Tax=Carpinus fangiana TaxID=176857 RepID=A0A5N6RWP1_9ROSI|nr:hypothetical protein FH972_020119 [Carpinus fangiana]